ncbi:MAG: PilN domain-containing protein [Tatlockia sp.]|nr:PilN domain-containing protein [Tatlockia sp.]
MTIEINLLPWRETRRRREKQKFINFALTGLLVVVLSCLIINYAVLKRMERQQNNNYYLRKEITILNEKIHEINRIKNQINSLVNKLSDWQKLQSSFNLVNHLFDELIKLIPEGVYLNFLGGNKNKITLEGISESNLSLSQLMVNIEKTPWMKAARLIQIKKEKPFYSTNHFTLNFILKPENVENLNQ